MKPFLSLLILLLTYISVPGQNSAVMKKVVLNTPWYPQAQFAGYYVAQEKGFYAKRGINAEFIFSTFNSGVTDNLTNRKADFGVMWLHEGIIAHNRNSGIINIAQFMDSSNVLIVARSKQIKSIGIWAPYVQFLKAYIKSHLPGDIEVIPVRNGNEAFIHKAVDAITVMNYNEYNQLINSGFEPSDLYTIKLSVMGLPMPEDGLYCMNDFYNNNKSLCSNFIEASIEGWKYALEHIDEAAEICMKYIDETNYDTNITMQRLMLKTIKKTSLKNKLYSGYLAPDKTIFNRLVKFLVSKNLISSGIEYAQFYRGN